MMIGFGDAGISGGRENHIFDPSPGQSLIHFKHKRAKPRPGPAAHKSFLTCGNTLEARISKVRS